MTKIVDARGLSCPQPVLLARRAVDAGEFPVEVWVDSVTSRENVRRMAEMNRCQVVVKTVEDEYHLNLKRE